MSTNLSERDQKTLEDYTAGITKKERQRYKFRIILLALTTMTLSYFHYEKADRLVELEIQNKKLVKHHKEHVAELEQKIEALESFVEILEKTEAELEVYDNERLGAQQVELKELIKGERKRGWMEI